MTGPTLALPGLGIILTASTLVWMISVRLEDASIADICWGLGFVLLVWLYCLLSPTLTSRSWLVASLITLWAVRLSLHIFRRNHGKEEDPRYRAMRASHGRAFWWRSLFTVFCLQGAILWLCKQREITELLPWKAQSISAIWEVIRQRRAVVSGTGYCSVPTNWPV